MSSRTQAAGGQLRRAYGFARGYGDDDGVHGYQRLFADNHGGRGLRCNAPCASTSRLRSALSAGKHVLCEKALHLNAREATELGEVGPQRTRSSSWRPSGAASCPAMQRAFSIAASGEIGHTQWVSADLGFPAPYDPSRPSIWALNDGGGALLDITVYPLLWALGTLGFPQTCYRDRHLGNEDGVDTQNAPDAWLCERGPSAADVVPDGPWAPDRHNSWRARVPCRRWVP